MKERERDGNRFDERLGRYALAKPFVPFDLLTAGGKTTKFVSRLQMAMGYNAVVIVLPKTEVQIVRKNTIAAIHVHAPE